MARRTRTQESADDAHLSLTIGALARRVGLPRSTIRYYESRGLVRPLRRNCGGHRRYGSEALASLGFVARCKALGFTLAQIAELLDLRGSRSCAEVEGPIERRIRTIDRTILQLQRQRAALSDITDGCRPGQRSGCVVMAQLENAAQPLR